MDVKQKENDKSSEINAQLLEDMTESESEEIPNLQSLITIVPYTETETFFISLEKIRPVSLPIHAFNSAKKATNQPQIGLRSIPFEKNPSNIATLASPRSETDSEFSNTSSSSSYMSDEFDSTIQKPRDEQKVESQSETERDVSSIELDDDISSNGSITVEDIDIKFSTDVSQSKPQFDIQIKENNRAKHRTVRINDVGSIIKPYIDESEMETLEDFQVASSSAIVVGSSKDVTTALEIDLAPNFLVPSNMEGMTPKERKKSNVTIGVRTSRNPSASIMPSTLSRSEKMKSVVQRSAPITPQVLSKIRESSRLGPKHHSSYHSNLPSLRLFDYFAIVGLGDEPIVEEIASDPLYSLYKPVIISRYPEHNFDIGLPPHLWMFCFPAGITLYPKSKENELKCPEFFFFTLTEIDGARFYGSCLIFYETLEPAIVNALYADKETISNPNIIAPKCICILSHHDYFTIFKECLMEIYRSLQSIFPYPIEYLLRVIHEVMIPQHSSLNLRFGFGTKTLAVTTSSFQELKLHDFNFHSLFHCLGIEKILKLFACILFEQKICIYSSNYTHLTITCELLVSLLEPFTWPHVFIPILPRWLLDFLQAPTPFIMGIHASYLIDCPVDSEIVYVDLDNRKLHIPASCSFSLPAELTNELIANLKPLFEDDDEQNDVNFENVRMLDKYNEMEIKTSFQSFFAGVFTNYTQHILYLRRYPDPLKVFNKAAFLRELESEDVMEFAGKFIDTQSFSVFLDGVEARHRSVFDDLIEIRKMNANEKHKMLEKQRECSRKSLFQKKVVIVPQSPFDYGSQQFSYAKKTIHSFNPGLVYPTPDSNYIANLAQKLVKNYSSLPVNNINIINNNNNNNNNDSNPIGVFTSSSNQSMSMSAGIQVTPSYNRPTASPHHDYTSYSFDSRHEKASIEERMEKYIRELLSSSSTSSQSERNQRIITEEDTLLHYQNSHRNFQNRISSSIDFKVIQFMNKRISQLFNSSPISGKNLSLLMELIKIDSARILFAKLLLQHHEETKAKSPSSLSSSSPQNDNLSKVSYDLLSNLILGILTEANDNSEFISASYLMNVSCIYYYTDASMSLHYLYENTRKHAIWSNNQFWESTFYNMIQSHRIKFYEKLRLHDLFSHNNNNNNNSSNNNNNDDKMKNIKFASMFQWNKMSEPQREHCVQSEEELIFKVLTYFINHMLLFGKSQNVVRRFIIRISSAANLAFEKVDILETLIDNLHEFLRSNLDLTADDTDLFDYFPQQIAKIASAQQGNIKELYQKLMEAQRGSNARSLLSSTSTSPRSENDTPNLRNCRKLHFDLLASDQFTALSNRRNTHHPSQLATSSSLINNNNNNNNENYEFIHNVSTCDSPRNVTVQTEQVGAYCVSTLHNNSRSGIECMGIDGTICVTGAANGVAMIWDVRNNICYRQSQAHQYKITCINFNEDNTATGSSDQSIKIWDTQTGACKLHYLEHTGTITKLLLDNNVLISSSFDNTLKFWDIRTQNSSVTLIGHTGPVVTYNFSDNVLISGSRDTTLKAWDIRYQKALQTFTDHQDWITDVKFNLSVLPNYFFSASCDSTVKLWNLNSQECDYTFLGHTDSVNSIDFNSTSVVSGSSDNMVKIWDLKSGKCHTIKGHTDEVTLVKFYDKKAVSAARDCTIRISDPISGKHSILKGHSDKISDFFLNSQRLVSSSLDSTLKVWESKTVRKTRSFHNWKPRKKTVLERSKKMLGM